MNLRENYEIMYQFIINEIMPIHTELIKCTMHILPNNTEKEIEYIFKVTFSSTVNDKNKLKKDILNELKIKFNLDNENLNKILLIFISS